MKKEDELRLSKQGQRYQFMNKIKNVDTNKSGIFLLQQHVSTLKGLYQVNIQLTLKNKDIKLC